MSSSVPQQQLFVQLIILSAFQINISLSAINAGLNRYKCGGYVITFILYIDQIHVWFHIYYDRPNGQRPFDCVGDTIICKNNESCLIDCYDGYVVHLKLSISSHI